MENININGQGVVYKKNLGWYHVQAGERTVPCTLSSHLQKRWIYSTNYQQKKDPVAIGDRVHFMESGDDHGMILEVLPRQNQFSRPAPRPGIQQSEQVIAANIDLVVPVFATAKPTPKWGLLDRHLVAAEAAGLGVLICITKLDLTESSVKLQTIIEIYRQIGYPVIQVNALTGKGLDELRQALQNRISVLVGKSGVGKSSLLNALQPSLDLRVQEISRINKGKHTTTHLEMFSLDFGGMLVDTPGIREFGLWNLYADELADCFPEMRPFIGDCKFRLDCRHDEEPGCAIRKAVISGKINPLRYKSYMRLLEELP
jgi:ribosome biogenesis GTPase / thiamine phosphate phosphatase